MRVLRELGKQGEEELYSDPMREGDELIYQYQSVEGKVRLAIDKKEGMLEVRVEGDYGFWIERLDQVVVRMVPEGVRISLSEVKTIYLWAKKGRVVITSSMVVLCGGDW